MSDTVPSPVSPEPTWAKPSVAVFTLAGYVVAYAIAYFAKSDSAINMLIGASITMAGTIVNFYFGSASGSQAKDKVIAAQVLAPTVVPVAAVPVTVP